MKIKCKICNKKVDEEEMLWAVDEEKEICKKCHEKQWKEGVYRRVMPLKCNVLVAENIDYPTVDTQFLFKWSEKILDNYNMTQDRGTYAPLPELLRQMFEEAWVIVEAR